MFFLKKSSDQLTIFIIATADMALAADREEAKKEDVIGEGCGEGRSQNGKEKEKTAVKPRKQRQRASSPFSLLWREDGKQ